MKNTYVKFADWSWEDKLLYIKACNGFIDYWKDNNTPIRYDSIRQFVKYAIYGK